VEWETSVSTCTETARASDGFLLSGVAYGGFEVRCERDEGEERREIFDREREMSDKEREMFDKERCLIGRERENWK
jgi:hypothetical protein